MPTIAFITLGCKVNQYDTQVMREIARQSGYEVVSESKSADIYVVNTCTVTHASDRKARQTIRKTKRLHPNAKILVTGCYADSDGKNIEEIEGVTLVFGNYRKKCLAEYLRKLGGFGNDASSLSESPHLNRNVPYPPFHSSITTFDGQTRALVKIQDGCNTFCTYCIVPHVRGRMTSRPIDDIVREIEALAQNGYKEVVITGIHLGAYGKDIQNSVTIADVLEQIHPIDGIERIRLSSIEPMDVPDDLIERIALLPKVAPHFHLPLQSGNNEILKLMGRRYTVEEYACLVGKIRATFPDVGITTDIMVGFPSETDAQFNDTYNFIKEMAFSRLHVFRYSPRRGTPAASYPGRIPAKVSATRSEAVRELGHRLAEEFHTQMLGKVMEALVEDSREGKDNLLTGFTGNYIRVLMDVPDTMINRMIRVRLVELEDGFVKGVLSTYPENHGN
ncbi:TPA: tRNA (N(6)-L-threonylcarbamoyladenosine(37)-C(2))-methylthiotransferase MtaB [Candidatus Poribacteria bacterium]|nr:tRNA (N(6)-L-threonylcarbamoyladenosine(37)-C(2))-methylthiotransferase MtaB [Candidatus Poribacteria bacterium]